jgi:hypothetical protein
MTAPTDRILTSIDPWEICDGDVLVVKRRGRTAEITVTKVETEQNSFHEHSGSWYGGEKRVTVTTSDGAILRFDEGDGDEPGIDELGDIKRASIDETAALLADAHLLDELVTPHKPRYDAPWYIRRDCGDNNEDEVSISPRQRQVLARVLTALREYVGAGQSTAPAPSVAAVVVQALADEIKRENAAIGVIADRLTDVREHHRFPKSTAAGMDRAISLSREAAQGNLSWVAEKNQYGENRWPQGSQSLLIQDWASTRGLGMGDGPQVPFKKVRKAMKSVRAIRATAMIVSGLAEQPLALRSLPKGLAEDLRSIVAELGRIAVGRTAKHLFAVTPDDPWTMTADDLTGFWNRETLSGLRHTHPAYRIQRTLYRAANADEVREILVTMLDAGEIDLDDVPVLICAGVDGRTPHSHIWPVERDWVLDH